MNLTWEDLEMSNTHVHHHFYHHSEETIIMKINELLAVNQSIKGQLNKAEAEIVAKLANLQAKIDELVDLASNADLPDDVVASITDLQTAAQALDDVNPDEEPVV
jgi:hypothetical protein